MASITHETGGRRTLQFKGLDGKRRSVRLGKTSKAIAETIAGHVQGILNAADAGVATDPKTVAWLAEIGDDLYAKLVRAELVHPRNGTGPVQETTIGVFAEGYLAKRTDMKAASRLVLGHVVRNLKDFFGESRDLITVTPAECDDFSRWLTTQGRKRGKTATTSEGLSPATIGKRLQWCSAIFRDAVRRKLIAENPFLGVKQPKGSNPERTTYVPVEAIERLIETTPSIEWKGLLAFARYLGLRCPSEPCSLRWVDVDWDRNRLKITSPKTQVHGKGFRVVPLLPTVRPHLERLYESAEEGAVWVFPKLRLLGGGTAADRGEWAKLNLRTEMLRLIDRAQLTPWPRLFHNLRASAQTDLAARFPIHIVCEWIGNTAAIAQEHYLQVTDLDFAAAVGSFGEESALQFPVQRAPETAAPEAHGTPGNAKTPVFQGVLDIGNSGGRI